MFGLRKFVGKFASDTLKERSIDKVVFISKKERNGKTIFKAEVVSGKGKETVKLETEAIPLGTIGQIRYVIEKLLEKGFLEKDDTILCVVDKSLGKDFEDMFIFFKIDKKFLEHTEKEIEKSIERSIYEAVLEIAREIAREGREGKKIGTIFVLGDAEKVMKKSEQLILNPLEGHPLEKRNIVDPEFKETIKSLAVLDGAFIIDNKGRVLAAGRYLIPSSIKGLEVESGLGTRHRAACAITKETKAIAICLSQEGTIRVYRKGKLIHKETPL